MRSFCRTHTVIAIIYFPDVIESGLEFLLLWSKFGSLRLDDEVTP